METETEKTLDDEIFEAVREFVRRCCLNLYGGDCIYFAGWEHPACTKHGWCRQQKWVEVLGKMVEKKEGGR